MGVSSLAKNPPVAKYTDDFFEINPTDFPQLEWLPDTAKIKNWKEVIEIPTPKDLIRLLSSGDFSEILKRHSRLPLSNEDVQKHSAGIVVLNVVEPFREGQRKDYIWPCVPGSLNAERFFANDCQVSILSDGSHYMADVVKNTPWILCFHGNHEKFLEIQTMTERPQTFQELPLMIKLAITAAYEFKRHVYILDTPFGKFAQAYPELIVDRQVVLDSRLDVEFRHIWNIVTKVCDGFWILGDEEPANIQEMPEMFHIKLFICDSYVNDLDCSFLDNPAKYIKENLMTSQVASNSSITTQTMRLKVNIYQDDRIFGAVNNEILANLLRFIDQCLNHGLQVAVLSKWNNCNSVGYILYPWMLYKRRELSHYEAYIEAEVLHPFHKLCGSFLTSMAETIRHEKVHNSLYYDYWSASEIIPNRLFIGSINTARNIKLLLRLGITHVITLGRENVTNGLQEAGIKSTLLDISEFGNESMYPHFPSLMSLMDEIIGPDKASMSLPSVTGIPSRKQKEPGGRLLVHCKMGSVRAPTLCAAFLIYHLRKPMIEIWPYIKARRSFHEIADPSERFFHDLWLWEYDVLGYRSATSFFSKDMTNYHLPNKFRKY